MGNNIDPRDPVYSETLDLIRATSDPVAIGNRLDGLSRIAREFERLELDVPAGLDAAISELHNALSYAVEEAADGWVGDMTYREFMCGYVLK